jgi:hypothetical protein
MKKIILLILTMVLITTQIFGQTISENLFFELGESDWIIQKDQNSCKDYYFDKLIENKDATFVLNLN